MSGNKLSYRIVNITFLNEFFSLWDDNEVIKYTFVNSNISLADTEKKLMHWIGEAVFVVLKNGQFIGVVGCPGINKDKGEYGFFYQFKRCEWGKGYAAEAAAWVVKFMKRNYSPAVLYADVVTKNIASEKILNHLKFRIIDETNENIKGQTLTVKHYKLNIDNKKD